MLEKAASRDFRLLDEVFCLFFCSKTSAEERARAEELARVAMHFALARLWLSTTNNREQ